MPFGDFRPGMGSPRPGAGTPRTPNPNYTPTPNPSAGNTPSWLGSIGRGMGQGGMPPMGGGPGTPPATPPATPPTGGPMNPPAGDQPGTFGSPAMPQKDILYKMQFYSQPPWVQKAYMQQWQQEAQAGQPLSTNWFNRGLFGMPENG